MKSMFSRVLAEFAGAFETAKRTDGASYVRKRDDRAPWITFEVIHAIHESVDDRGPNDWIYASIASVADTLNGYDTSSADKARDRVGEIADSLVDVYNADLTAWLSDHLGNAALCDEAVSDGLASSDASLFDRIGVGQYVALERIANAVIDACETEANDRETAIADGSRCPDDLSEHPSVRS